jgi:hypothetical protein
MEGQLFLILHIHNKGESMNAQLLHLAYLVSIKNTLNRKRRRFYRLINPQTTGKYGWDDKKKMNVYFRERVPKIYTKAFVTHMYRNAQKEMRAVTPLMRQVRKEAGAKIMWGSSGNIIGIKTSEKKYLVYKPYYPTGYTPMQQLIDMYHVDAILLGDK